MNEYIISSTTAFISQFFPIKELTKTNARICKVFISKIGLFCKVFFEENTLFCKVFGLHQSPALRTDSAFLCIQLIYKIECIILK